MPEGRDLGAPVHLEENPAMGDISMPVRPLFTIVEAHIRMTDPAEYEQPRRVLGVSPPNNG